MEENAIFQDYQRAEQYRNEQRGERVIDPEELQYWLTQLFKDETTDFKPEPESDEPF